ncbi:MAG TPA: FAD-dependent oxidoreductase [Ignavibacteria bacterium]|nr:FAD-dependent oxidoreductase [Ignavibacteria bacterium]
MTTRRDFIKTSSVVLAGAMVTPKLFNVNLLNKPNVIIVGAGLAGLSAGKILNEKGVNVKILEARNRIGGRVFSYDVDGLVIELGAEWVGASHERMIELCKEYDLELHDNRFSTHKIIDSDYRKPGEWDFTPEWNEKYDKIIADYKNYTDADKKRLDKMDWWRFLVNHDIPEQDLILREYLDSTDFGESIRFVSAYMALAEYAESSEFNEMDFKIKGGNSKLTEAMAKSIGLNKIHTNKKVTEIDYSGSSILVKTSDGEIHQCDKLIFTTPTYAMSKIKWNPILPEDKTEAINALQYCRINKNATLFNQKMFSDNFDLVSDTYSHYFYHATKFQSPDKGVLISYSVGDKADIIGTAREVYRIEQIKEDLNYVFGDVSNFTGKNVNYYWGEDEYSKGAYAIYGKDQWFRYQPIFKRNLDNKIFFAGEHIADWQGFMEGAINTGEEAAEEVMS